MSEEPTSKRWDLIATHLSSLSQEKMELQQEVDSLRTLLATYEAALVEISKTAFPEMAPKLASDALAGQSTIADRLGEAEEIIEEGVIDISLSMHNEKCRAYLAKWKERG
jgi:hypothetical protein